MVPMPNPKSFNANFGCTALFLTVLGLSISFGTLFGQAMLLASPPVFMAATALATATAIPYGAFLLWLDRNEKEPLALIAIAFLWGAMGATVIGGTIAAVTQFFVSLLIDNEAVIGFYGVSIAAPIFEEVVKGLGVLAIAIAFRNEFDNVLDGIVYGAMVGLGFAWFENILYYYSTGQDNGFAAMIELALARGVFHGLAGHVTFTALTGLGLGLARVQRKGWLRWLWPVLGLGLGIISHFIWNTFASILLLPAPNETIALLVFLPVAVILLQLPFVLLVGLILGFVWNHENEIIVASLEGESSDLIQPQIVASLVPARARTTRGLRLLMAAGPRAWWRQRTYEQTLIELAFALWHHRSDSPNTPSEDNTTIERLRQRITTHNESQSNG